MQRVLYAEDNAGMRRMVCCFLEAAGLEVTAVTDGDEAIEIAQNEYFDVILLDVTMERIDGMQAASIIRQSLSFNSAQPIIGLTARSEIEEIEACHNAGMSIVLTKPINLELLLETVCKAQQISRSSPAAKIENLDNKLHASRDSHSKVIDIAVLTQYRNSVGIAATEGILRDFSDIWPRKIGELYTSIVTKDCDRFSRAAEELGAAAAGIGASKVANKIAAAMSEECFDQRALLLPEATKACEEVQAIINALAEPAPKSASIAI